MTASYGLAKKVEAAALTCALVLAMSPAAALAAGMGDMGGGDMGGGMSDSDMGGGSGGGGADTMTFDYSGSYTGAIEADGTDVSSDGESYDASTSDQNAALAQNGGSLTLANVTLTKSGDDNDGDNCNFYGVNSIVLAVGEESTITLADSVLSATSEGSNGVFATDSATVYVTNTSISTSSDNSRGLDATYGGTIVASAMTIATQGSHCAGVATDRGGGYVSLSDATITTAGEGSPILYSTGDVEVSGVTGTTTGSQLCGMEGLNTILINDSTLTSTVTGKTASDPIANGVIIYQSTSGDAEASTGETATFQVASSTLSSAIESGAMFYITNTTADIVLYDTTLDFDSDAANLILAAGNDSNSWGSAGSNGGIVTVTTIQQEMSGVIEADTISSVELYLTNGSTWTGYTLISENDTSSTSDEPICVNIDETSAWVVTESCTLSSLTVADGGQVVDASGNTVTIVANGSTVVEGTSDITVTVDSYSTDYDSSAAGTLSEDLIDRSDFDDTFGTETTWVMGESSTQTAAEEETTEVEDTVEEELVEEETEEETVEEDSEEEETTEEEETEADTEEEEDETSSNPIIAFFQSIWAWFKSLFGWD